MSAGLGVTAWKWCFESSTSSGKNPSNLNSRGTGSTTLAPLPVAVELEVVVNHRASDGSGLVLRNGAPHDVFFR